MRSVRRVLSVLLAAALMTPVVSAAGLQSIRSVSFADANIGYMGGYNAVGGSTGDLGFISVTQDGGSTWRSVRLSGPTSSIVSVASTFNNASNAFAGPTFGRKPVVTSNGGGSWTPIAGNTPGSEFELSAVERLVSGRLIVVGKYSSVYGGQAGMIGISDNGGSTWTRAYEGPLYPGSDTEDPMTSNAVIRDVDFHSGGQVGWAAGTERTPNAGGNEAAFKQALIFKSTNGGQAWSKQEAGISGPGITGLAVTAVDAVSNDVAYIAGNYWVVRKTINGGTNWIAVTNPASQMPAGYKSPGPNTVFNDIQAYDANTVVAVGTDGIIARSTNGGTSWVVKQMPQKKTLRSVAVVTATKWIAAGDDEVVYRTTDGGATWTTVSSGKAAPTVAITAPSAGFAMSTGSPIDIMGTAADAGVGVAGAEVSIKRADGRYFDGSTWVTAEKWLTASSPNGGRNWSYAWTPDSTTVASGQVWVRARAQDGLRNYASPKEIASRNTRKSTGFVSLVIRDKPAYKQASYLSGVLISGTAKLGGRSVTLQRLSNRTSGSWVNVTSKLTDSAGYVKFDIPASPSGYNYTKTIYRLAYNGAPGYSPSQSANRTVHPKVALGKPWKSAKTIKAKKTFTWYSWIKPRHAAGSKALKLEFQRYVKGKPRAYKTVSATAYNHSTYSRAKVKIKLPYKGTWRVRAVHSDTGHAKSTSAWYKFTVK